MADRDGWRPTKVLRDAAFVQLNRKTLDLRLEMVCRQLAADAPQAQRPRIQAGFLEYPKSGITALVAKVDRSAEPAARKAGIFRVDQDRGPIQLLASGIAAALEGPIEMQPQIGRQKIPFREKLGAGQRDARTRTRTRNLYMQAAVLGTARGVARWARGSCGHRNAFRGEERYEPDRYNPKIAEIKKLLNTGGWGRA
ncbi:MAG: hypothetical protein ACREJM_13660 [Candidatus Saccharimonadales bacterium]